MTIGTSATEEENNNGDQKEEQMWLALKRHIIRERQRKKEEHEAEVEEERLRKEREARERQDVMTLGETREQIQQLEIKLSQLKEEKHQLFLQLKKVLNEDDNRKRQQFKDSKYADSNFAPYSEMLQPMNGMMTQGAPTGTIVQSQLFLPPTAMGQGGPPPNHNRQLSAHLLNKGPMQPQGGLKRGRSPSPPYNSSIAPPPVPSHLVPPPSTPSPYATLQHQQHQQQLKHPNVYTNQSHKMEDGRIGREMARAVLWNKSSQYGGMSGNSGGVSAAAYFASLNPTQDRAPLTTLMYATPPPPPPAHLPYQKPHYHVQETVKHDTIKKDPQNSVMISLNESGPPPPMQYATAPPPHVSAGGPRHAAHVGHTPPPPHATISSHNPMVAGSIPIYTTVQGGKPGGITSGYPVRPPPVSVPNQNIYPNRHRY